jgi:cytochrome c oxidase assembly protein subunit 15
MIHFVHRNLALLLLVLLWWLSSLLRHSLLHTSLWERHGKRIGRMLLYFMLLQFSLGIATLVFQVPLVLALLHQMCALLLLGILIYTLHYLHTCLFFVRHHHSELAEAPAAPQVSLHYL